MDDNREEPRVSSTLRWADVSLPASMSVKDLDGLIFSTLKLNWRKTAMIVGATAAICEARSIPVSAEMIAARIQALAELGRIGSQGNLSMWRHSEVRLS